MICFVYYALCKNGIFPILGDYKNKRMNLILNESKEIYLSFDGFVPDDIQNAYVIHKMKNLIESTSITIQKNAA